LIDRSRTTTLGITRTVIQAPSVNLVAMMMTSATPVADAPSALSKRWIRFALRARTRLALRCARRQCTTMPICDIVKVRNAPIANGGIRRSVMPRNTTSKIPAAIVR